MITHTERVGKLHAIVSSMNTEYVLFAVKIGSEDWEEEVITSTTDKAKLLKASQWAKENGFDRLRVFGLDLSKEPDFKNVLN